MKLKNQIHLVFVVLILFQGCVQVSNPYSTVPPGIWRGTLDLSKGGLDFISTDNETDRVFTELSDAELPFNFEVIYDNDTSFHIEIINGTERIMVRDVYFGKDKVTNQDTLKIDFPVFDSYVSALYEEDKIEGFWHVNYRENYRIPFNAVYGQNHRFTHLKKAPIADLSGKWECTFELGTEDEYKGIGEFQQNGNRLTGTFLTETGDYRYLEGTVQGNKAYLSCFDGSHAFLFTAKILEDGKLIGAFRSGTHYLTTWEAERNDTFELSHPDELTYIKGQEKLFFEFENTKGEKVSINDKNFDGRVSIISLFGTWCPNCRDEMTFLKEYLALNENMNLNVLGIAFERYEEKDKSIQAIERYRERMEIPFELLYGGYYDKEQASRQFPMLNKIISYPTIIILDKQRNVRRIHTGFSGPATSKYEDFKTNFDKIIKELVNE